MVRIPLPSVPQHPVPSGRYVAPAVTPPQDATGRQLAGLGEGVQGLGFEMSRRADWQQDQLDDAQITEADNLTADAVREAKMGYLAKVGRDATGDAKKRAGEDLDKRIEQIGQSLSPQQQQRWRERANARRQAAAAVMDGHETDQTINYRKGSLVASIEASRIDGLKPTMLKAVDDLSRLLGEDETQNRMRRLDETTKYHEDRIRILAKSKPEDAAAMLKEASAAKEIRPDVLDNLQGVVKQADADEKALTLFRTIVADPTRQDMTLGEQERIARTILDYERDKAGLSADVYNKTRAQIEYHFNAQHQLRETQRKEVLQQAETTFAKDRAATPESLAAGPLREPVERLGIYGDLQQKWAEVRGRQLSQDSRELRSIKLERDVQTLGILNRAIEALRDALPPDDATPAAVAEFERDRKKKLAYYEGLLSELMALDSSTAELRGESVKTKKSEPKKSSEEKLRDLSKAIRESQGR